MNFYLIAAAEENLGIGKNGKMPWGFTLKKDLEHFQKLTVGNGKNAVIMGRTTWESIPEKHRPLPERINIILTRQKDLAVPAGVKCAANLDEALALATKANAEKTFIIGGAQVYAESITQSDCAGVYLTEILAKFDCDAFFPKLPTAFVLKAESEVFEENKIHFKFIEYSRS